MSRLRRVGYARAPRLRCAEEGTPPRDELRRAARPPAASIPRPRARGRSQEALAWLAERPEEERTALGLHAAGYRHVETAELTETTPWAVSDRIASAL